MKVDLSLPHVKDKNIIRQLTQEEYLAKVPHYGGEEKCDQCNGKNEPYMVTNFVWKQAREFKGLTGLCCLKCLEKNLGRELTIADFANVPINQGIFGFDAYCYVGLGRLK